jgi:CHAT domain-containing protein
MNAYFGKLALATGLVVLGLAARAGAQATEPKSPPPSAEQAEKLKERDALVPQIEKAQAENRLDDAVRLIEKMMALEKVIFGPVHLEVAGSLDWLGSVHAARGDTKASRQARMEALEMYTKLEGAKHWRTIDVRIAVERLDKVASFSADDRQRFAEAEQFLKQVRTLRDAKKYKQAIEAGLKANELYRKIFGVRDRQTLNSIDWLAWLATADKDYAGAEQYRRQYLEGVHDLLGDQHPDYAYALGQRALVWAAQGKHADAAADYRDAWKLSIKLNGVQHKDSRSFQDSFFDSLKKVIAQHVQKDDMAAARKVYEEMLALQTEHLGKSSALVDSTRRSMQKLEDLAKLTGEQRRMVTEAEEAYSEASKRRWNQSKRRQALEPALRCYNLRRQALGERHAETDSARVTIEYLLKDLADDAAGLEKQGRLAEARPLREEVLAASLKVQGEKHWRTTEARVALADLELLGKLAPAERASLFEAERDVADASAAGQFPDRLRRFYEAEARRAETALELRRRLLGAEHPKTAAALRAVGLLSQRLGRREEARVQIEKSLSVCEKVLGKDHPDTVSAREALGAVIALGLATSPYGDLGAEHQKKMLERDRIQEEYKEHRRNRDRPRAIDALQRMLALEREVYGDFHPDVAASFAVLGELYEREGKFAVAQSMREGEVTIKKAVYGDEHWQTREARFFVKWTKELARLDVNQRRRLFACLDEADRMIGGPNLAKGAQLLLPTAEKGSATVRQILGPNHLYYGNTQDGLALLYSTLGDFARSEAAYRRAADVTKALLGPTHPGYRERMQGLANVHERHARALQGAEKWTEARTHLETSAAVNAQVFGASSWQTLLAQTRVAHNQRLSQLTKAQRESLEKAATAGGGERFELEGIVSLPPLKTVRARADLCTELLGDDFDETAESLTALGLAYARMNNYAAALVPLQRAVAIRKKLFGTDQPPYAECSNELALVYYQMGDYARAEPLFQEARRSLEKSNRKHPIYASSLNNLVILHAALGDYPQSEALSKEALQICRAWAKDPDTNPTTDRLYGRNYRALLGEFSLASALYRDGFIKLGDERREGLPEEAYHLNSLALLEKVRGNYDAAEKMLRRSLDLILRYNDKKEESPAFLGCADNLAILYGSRGDYDRAELLLAHVVRVRKGVGDDPLYATALNNLGHLRCARGDLAGAEAPWTSAHETYRAALGDSHPSTVLALANLALLADAGGNGKLALDKMQTVLEQAHRNLQLTASVQSERQQLLMLRQVRGYLDYHLSLAERLKLGGDQAYAPLLTWKGTVYLEQKRLRELSRLAAAAQPAVAKTSAELVEVTQQLASIVFGQDRDPLFDRKSRIGKLAERKEGLERVLAGLSAEYRGLSENATAAPARLLEAFPAHAALVDFLEYTPRQPTGKATKSAAPERRLVAFVLRNGQPIRRLDLGPAARIADAITRWRRTFGGKDTTDPGAELRRLVWEPLEPELKGVSLVLYAPDGALTALPLAALPGQKPSSCLLEERTFAAVPMPQTLIAPRRSSASTKTAPASLLLVGDVDFNAAAGPETTLRSLPTGPGEIRYASLPGTAAEIEAVHRLFERSIKDSQVAELRKDQASVAAFRKQAAGRRYIHLATHGFFSPAGLRSALAENAAGATSFGEVKDAVGWNPGVQSGLVFSGANATKSGAAGVLTALEVAELDLRAADMVVLSACETGLGEVAGGEGVFGLQRAFHLAGARSVVASLWQVDDRATSLVMVRFYENLFGTRPGLKAPLSRAHSLAEAQRWLRSLTSKEVEELTRHLPAGERVGTATGTVRPRSSGPRPYEHPYYWSAFMLMGDPE